MKFKELFLIAGIVLLITRWKGFFLTDPGWIVLSFVLWAILTFISIHNKNKEARRPKPVYNVGEYK